MADESEDRSNKSVEEQIGWTLGKGFSFLRSAGRKLEKAGAVKDIKRAFQEELERKDEPPQEPSTEEKSGPTDTKETPTS